MCPLRAPSSYSAPCKVFLLGEYSVLQGGPCLVGTTGPRFSLTSPSGSVPPTTFAPESPAGRFLARHGHKPVSFHDPLKGRGGWGASSAQYVLLYRALFAETAPSPLEVWKHYRELTEEAAIPPSGADVIAQWVGGLQYFEPRTETLRAMNPSSLEHLFVFSATLQAGRKIATHEHLATLKDSTLWNGGTEPWDQMKTIVDEACLALERSNPQRFGWCMKQYAELLHRESLELPQTSEDRAAFETLEGVYGVKGTGALQADGLVVLASNDSAVHDRVQSLGQERHLELICRGLAPEAGVQCES